MNYTRESSSFRDPDGFVFYAEGEVYRAVRPAYYPTLDALFTSGLLKKLTEDKKLTAFENIDPPPVQIAEPCKVLKAERIPFIAHPCELTFTALRKAALLTLILQEQALLNGFSLKDASVFNVQFRGPRAVYIDLLSFEPYEEGTPWVAYGQFIRHFLGPLMLMHYGIPFVNRFFRAHLDGIPVSLTSALLPARSRLSLAALTHIHTHARLEKNSSAPQKKNTGSLKLSKKRQLQIIAHLRETVRNLRQPKQKGVWTDYYDTCNYSDEGTQSKKDFVTAAATELKPRLCLDLGANTGEYSEAVAPHCRYVLASDAD